MLLKVRWNVLKRIMNLDDLAFLKLFLGSHKSETRPCFFRGNTRFSAFRPKVQRAKITQFVS